MLSQWEGIKGEKASVEFDEKGVKVTNLDGVSAYGKLVDATHLEVRFTDQDKRLGTLAKGLIFWVPTINGHEVWRRPK